MIKQDVVRNRTAGGLIKFNTHANFVAATVYLVHLLIDDIRLKHLESDAVPHILSADNAEKDLSVPSG